MEENNLSPREQERYDIIRACIDGDITNELAANRLGLKKRWIQCLKRAVKKKGKQGVIHGSKGQLPPNATANSTVKKVTAFLKQKKHQDFGPTFASEKLAKQGIVMNTETLRLLMIKQGLWKPQRRRGPQIVRQWRERKECFGELVQFDGSYHDWFETGGEECLLAAVDDATSRIVRVVFDDNEGIPAVFRFWWAYVEAPGRPGAIYLDKFSTYKVNHKNAVDNAEFITQFQRAMTELDIRVICANSPEAKGRVERLFGTLQDRLVKELRLMKIKTRDQANSFFQTEYLPDHNHRFSVPAKNTNDARRPLTDDLKKMLPAIFSIQSKRRVNNDYTIQFKTRWLQLTATQPTVVYKGDQVVVEERLNGTIHIRLKEIYLEYHELPDRPKPVRIPVTVLTKQKPTWTPPADHPWRNYPEKISPNTKYNNTDIKDT